MSSNNYTPGTHFGNVSSSTSADTKKTLTTPSTEPLAPTNVSATATGSGDSTEITLICTVYVSEKNMPKNTDGSNDYSKKINFEIDYLVDSSNKVTIYVSNPTASFSPATVFYAYIVPIGFKPSEIPGLSNNFTSIEVINWDADPEGSRGTEVTVQRPSL